jgi:hypothetical protein
VREGRVAAARRQGEAGGEATELRIGEELGEQSSGGIGERTRGADQGSGDRGPEEAPPASPAGVLDLDLVAVEQGDAAVRLSPARAARLRGAAGGILTSTRPELKKARGIFFFFIYLLGGGLRRVIV